MGLNPYLYTTNGGSITITGYSGPGGTAITIPAALNGLPVTGIGTNAFNDTSLTSVTIPGSVTNIGSSAFASSSNLTSIYFTGNAPSADSTVFSGDSKATVYYFNGNNGWGSTFGGLPAVGLSPYLYTTNGGNITITGYSGPGGTVIVPSIINGLPVTSISTNAFYLCSSLTSITVPGSVISIGPAAFENCSSLTNAVIANGVTSIGVVAFAGCSSLFSITIPNSVANIGVGAFANCNSLTSVTIGNGVTSIGSYAFADCTNLTGVYFQGNAPSDDSSEFIYDTCDCILPAGDHGLEHDVWRSSNGAMDASEPADSEPEPSFGVQTNGFGFTISWATNISVVVEAGTDLANPIWSPVETNTLTGGSSYFSDPQWTNYPGRFYRLRSP